MDNPNNPIAHSAQLSYSDLGWRELRREERRACLQGRARSPYIWAIGVVLILMGVLFMLQNLGFFLAVNWWALLFFIPACGAVSTAWAIYRRNGSLMRSLAASLVIGFFLAGVGLTFLLNLNMTLFWPLFLVGGGLVLLAIALFHAGQ